MRIEIAGKIVGVALAATLAGCGGTAGSGKEKTESRPVSAIRSIRLVGVGELMVTQGKEELLNVTTDDNLLPLVETNLSDGQLTLTTKANSNPRPSHPIAYQVQVKEVESLSVDGVGKLGLNVYKGKQLKVEADGVGEVVLAHFTLEKLTLRLRGTVKAGAGGYCDDLDIDMQGVATYDGKHVTALRTTINSQGAGEAVVYAQDSLDANLGGVGSVIYYGRPKVTQKGSGTLTMGPEKTGP